MKRLSYLLLLGFIVVSSISCKKESGSNYYVKYKLNGNWITWTKVVGELGPDLLDPSKTNFGFNANDDASNDLFTIDIQVDGTNLSTGTYSTDNPNYYVLLDYVKNMTSQNIQYFSLGSTSQGANSNYTVTLTSITNDEVRGNFTGNFLIDGSSPNEEVMNITEGEFVVQRIR